MRKYFLILAMNGIVLYLDEMGSKVEGNKWWNDNKWIWHAPCSTFPFVLLKCMCFPANTISKSHNRMLQSLSCLPLLPPKFTFMDFWLWWTLLYCMLGLQIEPFFLIITYVFQLSYWLYWSIVAYYEVTEPIVGSLSILPHVPFLVHHGRTWVDFLRFYWFACLGSLLGPLWAFDVGLGLASLELLACFYGKHLFIWIWGPNHILIMKLFSAPTVLHFPLS